jgi:hypothetical protein
MPVPFVQGELGGLIGHAVLRHVFEEIRFINASMQRCDYDALSSSAIGGKAWLREQLYDYGI